MSVVRNRFQIAGNVTKDPEIQQVGRDNKAKVVLGVAVNDRIKKGDQWVEETVFFDIEVWQKAAEFLVKNARKGTNVDIEGRMRVDQWEKDGKKYSKLVLTATHVQIAGPLAPKPPRTEQPSGDTTEDTPF